MQKSIQIEKKLSDQTPKIMAEICNFLESLEKKYITSIELCKEYIRDDKIDINNMIPLYKKSIITCEKVIGECAQLKNMKFKDDEFIIHATNCFILTNYFNFSKIIYDYNVATHLRIIDAEKIPNFSNLCIEKLTDEQILHLDEKGFFDSVYKFNMYEINVKKIDVLNDIYNIVKKDA